MNEKRLYPSRGLHGQVAHEIGRQVVSGAIPEGAFLPREAELAGQFSVSRQAVREALKVLAAKGLVVSRRRTGTMVLPRSSWNLLDPDVLSWYPPSKLAPRLLADLIEVRRLIEPAAAAFAAIRGDKDRIAEIGVALEDMRSKVHDADAFRQADAGFHIAVFSASGNEIIERLSDIIGPLLEASFLLQDQARGMEIAEAIMPAHEAIHGAIVAGNGARARREMEDLLSRASKEVASIVGTATASAG